MKLFEEWLSEKKTEEKEHEEDEFDGKATKSEYGKEDVNDNTTTILGNVNDFNDNDSINMEPAPPYNAGLTPKPVYNQKVTSDNNVMHNTLQQTQKRSKQAHY